MVLIFVSKAKLAPCVSAWCRKDAANSEKEAEFHPPRVGDIKDSLANISKAQSNFGYNPQVDIKEGLEITLNWFKKEFYPELN